MKFLASQLSYFIKLGIAKRNIKVLLKFISVLITMIITYSILFHFIMEFEGQSHSWVTGFYWTLTVMTTLGFGDITFSGDLGRIFSIMVLMSGVVFLLVLLPFTFIQFFYAPWIEARSQSRAPRELPIGTSDHIIITSYEPVTIALIEMLVSFKRKYVLLLDDLQRALQLYDEGYNVAVGKIDDIETYRKMQVKSAAAVVAIGGDEIATNIAFTVREISKDVPIITNAISEDSVDILDLAGSTHVLQLKQMLGFSLGRRTIIGGAKSNIIGRIGDVIIAEAPAIGTPLVGKTIKDSKIRENLGVNVVGLWERGVFIHPMPDTIINKTTVLVLAGTEAQIDNYDETFCIFFSSTAPAIILGGGMVGKAIAQYFEENSADYRIIERNPHTDIKSNKLIVGNAADINVLKKAGFDDAPSVIITTRDDATNIYLTIYCRRLRPNIQIISRANLNQNISTLHRAGADLVMSYSSLGANAIYNLLRKGQVLMLAEGLDVFKYNVTQKLAGKNLIESEIRNRTKCSVIAVFKNGETIINPQPTLVLSYGDELVLIGSHESEELFINLYT